ncbi:dihydroorotase [Virgibacillus halotolerans]|uniref:amidohydrolase/deacetylase family metallohydrolase n=1 Tax=Virgibacillus halotolerans TaxID=1071053 RepID=UPI001961875A|nr:amidohydrolase/deacetylase family metallohydrolase [Virgibacillus halotolerans]MBM7599024.1 dihydroorotase [Virgibacillus halotolerans]
MKNQLLINGVIIDPDHPEQKNGVIGIQEGRFVDPLQINTDLAEIIDLKGAFVAPGFIDIHVHVFENHTILGVNADEVGITQGVTTIVDAGSSGVDDFSTFRENIINKNETEVLAFLNISRKGLVEGVHELENPDDLMSMYEATQIFSDNPSLVGIKLRLSRSVVGKQGILPLLHAREIADQINIPLMVHIGNPPPYLPDVFPILKKGDIVTHAFHGKKYGILDENEDLIQEAKDALDRGVLFDIGHGSASFSYNTLEKFKERYPYTFTTSTDIHIQNINDSVGSLMVTMTKLLQLGYTLHDVVKSVTALPKNVLNLKDQGSFTFGTRGDVSIFRIIQQEAILKDAEGYAKKTSQLMDPEITIRNGKIVWKKLSTNE